MTPTLVDFDGDGRSDVLLYNTTSGQAFELLARPDGSFATYGPFVWAPDWVIGAGDFDGNGSGDLLFANPLLTAHYKVFAVAPGVLALNYGYWAPIWSTIVAR
jgi:hypothetical protein